MLEILNKIRGKRPQSAADLEAAIAEAEAALPAARDAWTAAEDAYNASVLDGTDAERDKLYIAEQKAERQYRDLDVALDQLRQRLEEAIRLERQAEIEKLAKDSVKLVDRQATILHEAGPMLERLCDLAEEFKGLDAQVSAARAELNGAQRTDLKPMALWGRLRELGWEPKGDYSMEAVPTTFPDNFARYAQRHRHLAAGAKLLAK